MRISIPKATGVVQSGAVLKAHLHNITSAYCHICITLSHICFLLEKVLEKCAGGGQSFSEKAQEVGVGVGDCG